MTENASAGKQPSITAKARRTLSTVSYDCGFRFYTAIGEFTGVTAVSLQDLAEKMRSINPRSVRFHFERGEFQRWIRTIFCDKELAENIALIPQLSDEELRRAIIAKIEEHISELNEIALKSDDWKLLLTFNYSPQR